MTTAEEMRDRTKKFAYRIIRLFRVLPRCAEAQIIGKQLLRSGTGVAANYRATGRARSHPEFTAKVGTVLEECDESLFWLECLADNGIVKPELLADLIDEATQLTKIFSASQQTAKAKGASGKLIGRFVPCRGSITRSPVQLSPDVVIAVTAKSGVPVDTQEL